MDEQPAAWTEVALLPVGQAEEELGVQPCYHCGEQLVPSALAVDRDGSLWIADSDKARITHFDRDGAFLEAFPAEIGPAIPDSSGSADLAFVGDRLYVLLEEGGSKIAPVGPGGLGEPITVNDGGKGLDVQALIPGQDELLVMIKARSDCWVAIGRSRRSTPRPDRSRLRPVCAIRPVRRWTSSRFSTPARVTTGSSGDSGPMGVSSPSRRFGSSSRRERNN